MKTIARALLSIVGGACIAAPLLAFSQAYPVKPIRVVIPFPPGGSYDLISQLVKSKVDDVFGQRMIIDHVGGGNGMVGAEQVARSKPDGYTLLFTTPSSQITPVYLNKYVPYDPVKDFTPIAPTIEPVTCLAVHSSVPANSTKELIDYAKRYPKKLLFGSSGTGSFFHLVGELFKISENIDIVHVPYKNVATAASDTAGGHIPMTFIAVTSALPFVAQGNMKVLALLFPPGYTGRFSAMPNVPSITETLPDFEKPASWFAYFGPADMQSAVVQRLNVEIVKAINAPDLRPKLDEAGVVIIGTTAQQFASAYKAGFAAYAKITKAAGIVPE